MNTVRVTGEPFDHLSHEVLEQHATDRQGQLVVLDAGGGEEVLDEPEEPVALPLHALEELGTHRGVVGELGLAQRLRVADEGGHGRAELMGHHGDELALHAVQLAELVDRVVLLLEERLELARLLGRELVPLGQSVGERAAPEVHLAREDERPEEHDDRPDALAQEEARDHGAEQPEADVRAEELQRRRAVHGG